MITKDKLSANYLLTQKKYVKLEKLAITKAGETGKKQFLAQMGKRDLFFLLVHILNRKDLNHPWLFQRCREVQNNPDGFMDLWAREHGKSSIITFGQTIRDILNSPEITVGIFSHCRSIAKDFLGQIKFEFEQNQLLKQLYPEILWENPKCEAPVWSLEKGIVVKRQTNPKEATVEAWGLVDGQPTGKHFSLLVYDDVVTKGSVSTPEMINKVTDSWALSLNLGARGGKQRYIGTRYHHNDTYKTILERKSAKPRIHPATLDGLPDGEPALLTPEDLAQKRASMGKHVFACQMLLNPQANNNYGFLQHWLKYWQKLEDRHGGAGHLNRYIVVDPAGSNKKNSDYTVMLVLGLGADQNWYLIDGIRDQLNLQGRAKALFRLYHKYRPLAVGYEQYGMQADIEFIQSEQERLQFRFCITPLGGNIPKKQRILALAPYFEQGRIYIPQSCPYQTENGEWQNLVQFFMDEYESFPVCAHDDVLDCLARVLDKKLGACFPGENIKAPEQAILDYNLFA